MRINLTYIIPLLLSALAGRHDVACSGTVTVERQAYTMGTLLRLEVTGANRACALAASEAALAEVSRLEGLLSSWRGDSEVGRLNAAEVGVPQPVTAELGALLEEASGYVTLTGGGFDPGIGALLTAWDQRGAGQVPDSVALARALSASGLARLRLDRGARLAARPDAAWWLDTGGFGKGAALRAAAAVLEAWGIREAVLDFGGQLLILGPARPVAVAHPGTRREAMPLWLRVGGGSVATTSASERYLSVGGTHYGHVVDPRSGRPVPAWGSVTVVSRDPLAADALATALFVLGPDGALAWAAEHPEHGVLVQEQVGGQVTVRHSSNLGLYPGPTAESAIDE